MSRQLSRLLDRLEAKERTRQSKELDTSVDYEAAISPLGRAQRSRYSRGWIARAGTGRTRAITEARGPNVEGQGRMTELVLREHGGTPLTDEESRELADLKRWCPPDPMLETMKAVRDAAQRFEDLSRGAALNSET